MDYGKYADTRLRDVPEEVFNQYKDRLPDNFRKRAEHYYSEIKRAMDGAKYWEEGNLESYGELVFKSGSSSINNYECGCDELIKLYDILRSTDGVYGARFSGAGFKGCCMALMEPEKEEEIASRVQKDYLKSFPGLEGKYEFHSCVSADGVLL
jgi:galactokinase/galacturonokinase